MFGFFGGLGVGGWNHLSFAPIRIWNDRTNQRNRIIWNEERESASENAEEAWQDKKCHQNLTSLLLLWFLSFVWSSCFSGTPSRRLSVSAFIWPFHHPGFSQIKCSYIKRWGGTEVRDAEFKIWWLVIFCLQTRLCWTLYILTRHLFLTFSSSPHYSHTNTLSAHHSPACFHEQWGVSCGQLSGRLFCSE